MEYLERLEGKIESAYSFMLNYSNITVCYARIRAFDNDKLYRNLLKQRKALRLDLQLVKRI